MTKARDVATQGGLVLISSTTITAQSTIQISNVFTSTYKSYKIVADIPTCSTSGTLTFQLTTAGTASTINCNVNGRSVAGNGSSDISSNTSSFYLCQYNGSYPGSGFNLDLIAPALAAKTYGLLQTSYISTSAYAEGRALSLIHEVFTAYDGIKLTASAGTVTGTLKIYGYKD